MILFQRLITLLLLVMTASVLAQQTKLVGGRPAVVLGNDKVELSVLVRGATLARLIMRDSEPISPYPLMGHFLCLDGFGDPSEQERAAGMPFHGEASRQTFEVISTRNSGSVGSLTMGASLPLAQERITRTFEVVDGENVVYVTSDLESLVAIDRPIMWTEHVTLGPPFLERARVVVDMPATNCRVRRAVAEDPIPGRLIPLRDFKWPIAPGNDGGQVDLRPEPVDAVSLDRATCQMDPQRRLAFVTALHLEKRILFGYIFRREDYPWLMNWMNYTGNETAARGIEFSMQAFDGPRRDIVELNTLFGIPAFRWLSAKSKIQTRFLLFYTKVPEGFTRVDEVTLQGGKLSFGDQVSGRRVVLTVSLEL